MVVNVRHVARKARVSIGTVSNALNRPEIVAPATLLRVQQAMDELGFTPNITSRRISSSSAKLLALILPDVSNPLFTEIARGAEDAANQNGYSLFLCNHDHSPEKERNYIQTLVGQNVAGIMIWPTYGKTDNLNFLRSNHIAVTLIDTNRYFDVHCSAKVDCVRGGQVAIQHLVDLGHREITYVYEASINQFLERREGAKQAAKDHQVALHLIEVPSPTTQGGQEGAKKFLSGKTKSTAIFCGNDLIALGFMRGLIESGFRIPEDFSVIGFDDIELAPNASVPLTTIAQDGYQLGYTATELAIQECEAPDTHIHQHVLFQPELVFRSSTAKPAHVREKISVQDLDAIMTSGTGWT